MSYLIMLHQMQRHILGRTEGNYEMHIWEQLSFIVISTHASYSKTLKPTILN